MNSGFSRKKAFILASAIALGFASNANAQESAKDKTEENIIVKGARIKLPKNALPNTIEIISKENLDIQTQIGGSAVDAVANLIPSFSPTRQKLSGAGETLRGRSPLYMVDGVPQSSPLRDDSRDGFTADPFFIDRVEVIFGSNAIQGIGGTGGIVNYVTVSAPKQEGALKGQVITQISGDDEIGGSSIGYKTGAFVGKNFGKFSALVGATYEKRGVYYDGKGNRIAPDGTQGDTMDSTAYDIFTKFDYRLSDNKKFEFMYNHFELEGDGDYVAVAGSRTLGRPATSVRGTIKGETPSNNVDTANLSYIDSDFFGGSLSAQIYYNDYHGVFGGTTSSTFYDPAYGASSSFDQSANNSTKKGARLTYDREIEAINGLRILGGLDYGEDETFQELLMTNRNWVPVTTLKSFAPFLQLNQALFDKKLNLSAGIRHEKAKISVDDYKTLYSYGSISVSGGEPEYSENLYNFGAAYELQKGVNLYASYAQGYTLPDVGRVLRAVTVAGSDVDTLLDVSPVVSDNIEIGLELNKGPVVASIAYFTSNSDKGALLVLKNDVYEIKRQKTEISGFELNFKWNTPVDGLTFNFGLADLRGQTDTDGDGEVDSDLDGVNISPDRANFGLSYKNGPFFARLQDSVYMKRDFYGIGYDPRNNFGGYSLVDLYLSYATNYGDISLSATNLLDRQYLSYNSDTRLPTDNLSYFAGRGRLITLGYSKKF
jgi:iron complex outermembrane receptor protein